MRITATHLFLIVLISAVILGSLVYTLAASNTVPAARAGDGASSIVGYTLTNVSYVLAANPQNLDRVNFTLDAAASSVRAKVVSGSSAYVSCTNTGGFNWSCDLSPDVLVTSADQLTVIAAE
jgi:hypothetical protein